MREARTWRTAEAKEKLRAEVSEQWQQMLEDVDDDEETAVNERKEEETQTARQRNSRKK